MTMTLHQWALHQERLEMQRANFGERACFIVTAESPNTGTLATSGCGPKRSGGYLRLITYCASSVLMVQYSRPLLRRRAVTESQTSFFYQYLVGLAFFVPGLLLGQRVGAWSFKEGERGPLFLLLVVFLCYLFAQAFLEFLGPLI